MSPNVPGAPRRPRGNWLFEGRRVIQISLLRRSRFVRVMKVALPLAAVAMVAAVIAWPQMHAQDPGFRLTSAAIDVGQEQPSMAHTRLPGTDRSAEIDFTAGTLSSDEKVWGQGPFGLLNANGLRVLDSGERIHFINGVRTTFYPQSPS